MNTEISPDISSKKDDFLKEKRKYDIEELEQNNLKIQRTRYEQYHSDLKNRYQYFENDKNGDTLIKLNDGELRVDSAYLAYNSHFFKTAFETNIGRNEKRKKNLNKKTNIFNLDDVTKKTFLFFLSLIYDGELPEIVEEKPSIEEIWEITHLFEILMVTERLKNTLDLYIKDNYVFDWDIYILADTCNLPMTLESCRIRSDFSYENMINVVELQPLEMFKYLKLKSRLLIPKQNLESIKESQMELLIKIHNDVNLRTRDFEKYKSIIDDNFNIQ